MKFPAFLQRKMSEQIHSLEEKIDRVRSVAQAYPDDEAVHLNLQALLRERYRLTREIIKENADE